MSRRTFTGAISTFLLAGLLLSPAHGSDPPETASIASLPGANLSDLYIFPSPANSANVVLVMTLHPFIPIGSGGSTVFDPNVMYQFKIDNTGDNVEDLVVQARFTGTSASQLVQISGPAKPAMAGTISTFGTPDSVTGQINTPFTLSNGLKVFAGAAEDPLFFDISQFLTIWPDRAGPLFGPMFTNTQGVPVTTAPTDPNMPMSNSFRSSGTAQDFVKGLNVMAIVVEAPRTMLTPTGTGKIHVWCTSSK